MMPCIKICGMTNLEDALFCANSGANAIGFIFYKKSSRYISPTSAEEIIKKLPHPVVPVGVFVNERRRVIEQIISTTKIRTLQLSGNESPEDCLGFGLDVWKAFRIKNQNEIDALRRYTIAIALLEGAKNGLYGGSGDLPDLSVASELKKVHLLGIAGGLSPDNILGVINSVQPSIVDVNSGVESAPGKKDHCKIKLLFDRLSTLSMKTT